MAWQDDCRARNMRPAVFPDGPNKGKPACQYFDASGHPRYAEANLSFIEKINGWLQELGDKKDIASGKVVEAVEREVSTIATATVGAIPKLAGHLFGVPPFLIVLALGFVGWRLLESYLPRK